MILKRSRSFKMMWTFLALVLITVTSSTYITRPQKKVYRNGVDTTGSMECVVDMSQGLPQVFWILETNSTDRILSAGNMFIGNVQRGKYTLNSDAQQTGNFTLTVNDLNRQDSGAYKCQVDEADASAHITVADPPGPPVITPTTMEFTETQTVTFVCTSSGGFYAPAFKWMKGGDEIAETSNNRQHGGVSTSSLSIQLTHLDHQASLSCEASNELETESTTRSLTVQYTPKVSITPNSLTVLRGTQFSLTCDIVANPSVSSINWLRDNEIQAETTNIVTVDNIQNDSTLQCRATNSIGTSSASISVSVHYAPIVTIDNNQATQAAVEGNSFSLRCDVDANPSPDSITWTQGGAQIRSTGDLTITTVRREDAGLYTCTAVNTVSPDGVPVTKTTSGSVTINVFYAPSKPILNLTPAAQGPVYNATQSVTFRCRTADLGSPEGSYTWWKEGSPSQIGTGSTYVIGSTSVTNSGKYWCEIENEHGSASSDKMQITVQDIPTLISRPNGVTKTVDLGQEDVTLTCIYQGFPRPEITWFKDGTAFEIPGSRWAITDTDTETNAPYITVTSTLYISKDDVTEFQNGIYSCNAQNAAGQATSSYSVTLDLQFSPRFAGLPLAAGELNQEVEINCDVLSNPTVTNIEFKRSNEIVTSGPRHSLSAVKYDIDGYSFKQRRTLSINKLEMGDIGEYVCTASNGKGSVERTIHLERHRIPDTPTDLTTETINWDSIMVTWTPGFDGGSTQAFIIKVKKGQITDTLTTRNSRHALSGLYPATVYTVKIASQNDKGPSNYSEAITVTTLDMELPTPTLSFDATSSTLKVEVNSSEALCVKVEGKTSQGYEPINQGCLIVNGFHDLDMSGKSQYQSFRARVCVVDRADVCSANSPEAAGLGSNGNENNDIAIAVGLLVPLAIIIIVVVVVLAIMFRRKKQMNKPVKQGHLNPIMTKSGPSFGSNDHIQIEPSIGYNYNADFDMQADPIEPMHYSTNYGDPYREKEVATPPNNDNLEYVYASVQKKSAEQNKLDDQGYTNQFEIRDQIHSHSNSDNTGDDFDDDLPPSPYRTNDLSFISDGHNIPVRRYPSFSESGYSTPDSKHLKKVVYEVIV